MKRFLLLLFLFLFSSNCGTSQSGHWASAAMPLFPSDVERFYTDTINNYLYAAGNISINPGSQYVCICRYQNGNWETICNFDSKLYAFTIYNGQLIAAGAFSYINSVPISHIARFDSSSGSWQPFGNFNTAITNLKVLNGELYAMGPFTLVDSVSMYGIAKWTGTYWVNVLNLPDMGNAIDDIAIYHNELYVAGNFYDSVTGIEDMARYHNGNWEKVGVGFFGGFNGIRRLEIYHDELYASGLIRKTDGNAGNGIQKWDGTVWSELGSSVQDLNNSYNGFAQVHDMVVYNNELYVSGTFYYAGHIPAKAVAKWDGTKWCGFGTSSEFDMLAFTIGCYQDTIYLNGGTDSINGVFTNYVIKWSGGNFVDTCSATVSVEEHTNSDQLQLFPNPAFTIVYIKFKKTEISTLRLKNILGEELLSKEINANEAVIDVIDFSPGIYFLSAQTVEGVVVKKFVKE